ncbi:MAG: recombinase family protein [Actinomycetota bacterium]|nr:recombinase family protein [Actinomycetota bacterium]
MNPLPSTDARRVVAYRRVSSSEQGKAYRPEAQAENIRAYAERHGLEVAEDIFEDASGTLPLDDRPGLRDALASVYRHGAGGVLVARADRLGRDEYVAFDAKRAFAAAGARVLYADSSNGDDDSALLLEGMQHVIAAHERRRIVARLKAGRDAKAARHPGSRAQGGRLPHGYRRTREGVEVDPDAAAEVRRVFELVRGKKSLAATAKIMSAETGRPWKPQVVERLVKREMYKQAEPARIVDPRKWNAAQTALTSRRRSPGPAPKRRS